MPQARFISGVLLFVWFATLLAAQQSPAPTIIGVAVDGPTTENVQPQLLAEAVAEVKRNANTAEVFPVQGIDVAEAARGLGVHYLLRISCQRKTRFVGEKVPSADYIEWRIESINAPVLKLREGWTPRADQVPQSWRSDATGGTVESRAMNRLRTGYFEMLRYWVKQAAGAAVRQLRKKHRISEP